MVVWNVSPKLAITELQVRSCRWEDRVCKQPCPHQEFGCLTLWWLWTEARFLAAFLLYSIPDATGSILKRPFFTLSEPSVYKEASTNKPTKWTVGEKKRGVELFGVEKSYNRSQMAAWTQPPLHGLTATCRLPVLPGAWNDDQGREGWIEQQLPGAEQQQLPRSRTWSYSRWGL